MRTAVNRSHSHTPHRHTSRRSLLYHTSQYQRISVDHTDQGGHNSVQDESTDYSPDYHPSSALGLVEPREGDNQGRKHRLAAHSKGLPSPSTVPHGRDPVDHSSRELPPSDGSPTLCCWPLASLARRSPSLHGLHGLPRSHLGVPGRTPRAPL